MFNVNKTKLIILMRKVIY